MPGISDLIALSGVPGIGILAECVIKMYELVDNVKVHKERCKFLRNQCVETLLYLRDTEAYKDGTPKMKEAIDAFEDKLLKIQGRMSEWAGLNLIQSMIKQSDISIGLDELQNDLMFSSNRFQMVGTLVISRQTQETQQVYDRDQAELRELLLRLIKQQDNISSLLNNNNDVASVMQTIQEEIRETEPEPEGIIDYERRQLEDALYFLHKESDVLPPLTDLTSEVKKTSDHPVAKGNDNDVYMGEWLGQEKVALKFTKGCNYSETTKKKFYKEVAIWRTLQHPNIVRLYGTATFGAYIYTVSPWMDNGNAVAFLEQNLDYDRRQFINEVAAGLNYLHQHGVAHGDVRCSSVLINAERVACISGFGLSVFISDVQEETGTAIGGQEHVLGSLRWRAPELINYPPGTRPVITPKTDVWSYGMLCLEAMTGHRPYRQIGDFPLLQVIANGQLPERPTTEPATLWLDDNLWRTLLNCWQLKPQDRLSMEQIMARLKRRGTIHAPPPPPLPPPPQPIRAHFTPGPLSSSPSSSPHLRAVTLPAEPSISVASVASARNETSPTAAGRRFGPRPPPISRPSNTNTNTTDSLSAVSPQRRSPSSASDSSSIIYPTTRPGARPSTAGSVHSTGGFGPGSPPSIYRTEGPPSPPIRRPEGRPPSFHRPEVHHPPSLHTVEEGDDHIATSPGGTKRSFSFIAKATSMIAGKRKSGVSEPVAVPRPTTASSATSTHSRLDPAPQVSISITPPSHSDLAAFVETYGPPKPSPAQAVADNYASRQPSGQQFIDSYAPTSSRPPPPPPPTNPHPYAQFEEARFARPQRSDYPGSIMSDDSSTAPELRFSSTGAIIAGTLPSLLHRLIIQSDSLELDLQFRDAFLTCYTSFTTAEEVYKALEHRYRTAERTNMGHSIDVCYTVLCIMRLWLNEHRVFPKDEELLKTMKHLAQSVSAPSTSTISKAARQLITAIDNREKELDLAHVYDRTFSSGVHAGFKASSAAPREFAIGLNLMAGDIYSSLLKSDFILWLGGLPGQEYVLSNIRIWDKLHRWTRKMILDPDDEKTRTSRITLFINISLECHRYKNYFCMSAIATACNHATVTQLQHSFGDLPKEAKEDLAGMIAVMDRRESYKKYKQEMLATAKQGKPVIPEMKIHLSELEGIWKQSFPTILDRGRDFINFERATEITDEIKRILSFQNNKYDLERYREAGALAYLEANLRNFRADDEMKRDLDARGMELYASEKKSYMLRDREIRDAGFGKRGKKSSSSGKQRRTHDHF